MPNMMRRIRTRLPTYLSTGFGAFDISSALQTPPSALSTGVPQVQATSNQTLLLGNIAEKFSNAPLSFAAGAEWGARVQSVNRRTVFVKSFRLPPRRRRD